MPARLSTVFVLVALTALTTLSRPGAAEPPQRFRFQSGTFTPADGQVLRIKINGLGGNDTIDVKFVTVEYLQDACNGAVCVHSNPSVTRTPAVTLTAAQAGSYSYDAVGNRAVRLGVETDTQKVIVLVELLDPSGRVIGVENITHTWDGDLYVY